MNRLPGPGLPRRSGLVQFDWSGRALETGVFMKLLRQALVWIVCGAAASAPALADDLAAQQPPPSPMSAAKAKAKPLKPVKPGASQADGLGGVKFSNPYAPPEGAGKATGEANFPAAKTATPVDPRSGLSFTYKWHASNAPVDPYWNIRNEYGPEGPGSKFLGGLKLGF